jgi:membrane protease YdiL (CAAX protease family)
LSLALSFRGIVAFILKPAQMPNIPYGEVWLNVLHSPGAWIFTLTLVVVFPILDYKLYARLKSTLQIYAWNICAEWALAAACLWQARSHGMGLADLGEQLGSPRRTLVVAAVLLALIAVQIVVGRKQKNKANPAQVSKAVDQVKRLIPLTGSERRVFVAVALTAGVAEEFLYRGWLQNLFAVAVGSLWVGLVISAVLFGVAHAYQGRSGIISSSLLGCVFGILFLLTGSLLLGQVLHGAMNLYNGLALGRVANRGGPGYATEGGNETAGAPS